jgi:large subunit ribosomal protein L3
MPKGMGILGQKVGMAQVFDSEGRAVGATVVLAMPCVVTRLRTVADDGYEAVQVATHEEKVVGRMAKAQVGQFEKLGMKSHRRLAEFRPAPGKPMPDAEIVAQGKAVGVSFFKKGDRVDVQGLSKGHGFQGVVKRHGFRGGPDTHGSMMHRAPGSVGASTDPGHTFRGTRMPGRMGGTSCTSQNLEVLEVDAEGNVLVLKGAVPGAKGSWLRVTPSVKRRAPHPPRLWVEVHDADASTFAKKTAAASAKAKAT